MSTWGSEGQPRDWKSTRIGQSVLRLGDKLSEAHLTGPAYKAIVIYLSKPSQSSELNAWMSGGEPVKRDAKRRFKR